MYKRRASRSKKRPDQFAVTRISPDTAVHFKEPEEHDRTDRIDRDRVEVRLHISARNYGINAVKPYPQRQKIGNMYGEKIADHEAQRYELPVLKFPVCHLLSVFLIHIIGTLPE